MCQQKQQTPSHDPLDPFESSKSRKTQNNDTQTGWAKFRQQLVSNVSEFAKRRKIVSDLSNTPYKIDLNNGQHYRGTAAGWDPVGFADLGGICLAWPPTGLYSFYQALMLV